VYDLLNGIRLLQVSRIAPDQAGRLPAGPGLEG
jgi:hypothetical protein